jgi:hypothetical protein
VLPPMAMPPVLSVAAAGAAVLPLAPAALGGLVMILMMGSPKRHCRISCSCEIGAIGHISGPCHDLVRRSMPNRGYGMIRLSIGVDDAGWPLQSSLLLKKRYSMIYLIANPFRTATRDPHPRLPQDCL